MDARQLKGFEIAKDKRLKCKGALWLVPSQTHAGHYLVDPREGSCTCLDHETRSVKCKHLWAVAYVRHEVVHPDGSVETTEVMRVTYRQDWPRYNAAQCGEKETVQALLRGLCDGIVQPRHEGRGRPPLPLADVVYGAAMKSTRACPGAVRPRTFASARPRDTSITLHTTTRCSRTSSATI